MNGPDAERPADRERWTKKKPQLIKRNKRGLFFPPFLAVFSPRVKGRQEVGLTKSGGGETEHAYLL